LLVGDSRFFPTLAGLIGPRELGEDGIKPVLKRRWKRSQVVLELPSYCIYRLRPAGNLPLRTTKVAKPIGNPFTRALASQRNW